MPIAYLRCLLTAPELYQVFGATYTPSTLEASASWALSWGRTLRTMCSVLSPVLAVVLYRRSFFSSFEAPFSMLVYIAIFYSVCVSMRAIGRAGNADYHTFMRAWDTAHRSPSVQNTALLAMYDYEASGRPIEYEWTDEASPKHRRVPPLLDFSPPTNAVLSALHSLVCYMAAHTIGISLMFPGTWFDQANPALLEGRRKLVEGLGARRASVRSKLGDDIDTVFLDRRPSGDSRLIITCEGNCGFYEVGVGTLATSTTHSVLAWNTPGFAGSGGTPWPGNVAAGIDVVLQYAVNKLHFAPEQIMILSWSIGGFAATHAGMQYSKLGGVILDATFEDVLPLARTVLPAAVEGIVHATVRNYLDLPNGRQMCKYDGPITIVRRTNDEMITTAPQGTPAERLAGNRSNNLLVILLRHRFAELFVDDDGKDDDAFVLEKLHAYITAPDHIHRAVIESQVDMVANRKMLAMGVHDGATVTQSTVTLPSSVLLTSTSRAHMAIFLAAHYMHNVDIGHNDKLPVHMIQPPVHPWQ